MLQGGRAQPWWRWPTVVQPAPALRRPSLCPTPHQVKGVAHGHRRGDGGTVLLLPCIRPGAGRAGHGECAAVPRGTPGCHSALPSTSRHPPSPLGAGRGHRYPTQVPLPTPTHPPVPTQILSHDVGPQAPPRRKQQAARVAVAHVRYHVAGGRQGRGAQGAGGRGEAAAQRCSNRCAHRVHTHTNAHVSSGAVSCISRPAPAPNTPHVLSERGAVKLGGLHRRPARAAAVEHHCADACFARVHLRPRGGAKRARTSAAASACTPDACWLTALCPPPSCPPLSPRLPCRPRCARHAPRCAARMSPRSRPSGPAAGSAPARPLAAGRQPAGPRCRAPRSRHQACEGSGGWQAGDVHHAAAALAWLLACLLHDVPRAHMCTISRSYRTCGLRRNHAAKIVSCPLQGGGRGSE